MTTATTPSFVNAAITNASNGKSTFAKLAAAVERRDEEHFCNRIGGAWASLVTERNQLRALDMEDNGTRAKDMPVKPEQFLSLCQFLMNQSCWAARRYMRALQANADQEAINGITGIDFSQEVAADLGVEPLSTDEIKEALHDDLSAMLKLHSIMASKMNYLSDIEDLHLYAEREQEGEIWRVTAATDDFDEALILMDAAQTRMAERQDAELAEEIAATDFAA